MDETLFKNALLYVGGPQMIGLTEIRITTNGATFTMGYKLGQNNYIRSFDGAKAK